MSDLEYLRYRKRYGQWGFVQMMRGLFPKGRAWQFPILREDNIQISGIPSEEQWGIPGVNSAPSGGCVLSVTSNGDSVGSESGYSSKAVTTDTWITIEMKIDSSYAYVRSDVGTPGTPGAWLKLDPEAIGTIGDSFKGICVFYIYDDFTAWLDFLGVYQSGTPIFEDDFSGVSPMSNYCNSFPSTVNVITDPISGSPDKVLEFPSGRGFGVKLIRNFGVTLDRSGGLIEAKMIVGYPSSTWVDTDDWREKNKIYIILTPDEPGRCYPTRFRPNVPKSPGVDDLTLSSNQVVEYSYS